MCTEAPKEIHLRSGESWHWPGSPDRSEGAIRCGTLPVALVAPVTMMALLVVVTRGSAESGDAQTIEFRPAVGNIDFDRGVLHRSLPEGDITFPAVSGNSLFGRISRSTIGAGEARVAKDALFMVEYSGGSALRAWCDLNFNGSLEAAESCRVYPHPASRGARSFLANLRWQVVNAESPITADWTIRVILDGTTDSIPEPAYKVQQVYAMVGWANIEGRRHRAFLFDGNADGIYSRASGDGIYIDVDDDRRFQMDPMSREFGPFSVPYRMASHRYQTDVVDPRGRFVSLRDIGTASPIAELKAGVPAPEFSFEISPGESLSLSAYRGRLVMVYFWASWCGACEEMAPHLVNTYECFRSAGLEIVAISYDSDRRAMEEFRERHRESWPASFTGRRFRENPIGELYSANAAGVVYLVNREGNIDGVYYDLLALRHRLTDLGYKSSCSETDR